MNLIPISISDIKDYSVINSPNTLDEIRLTFNVEVVSTIKKLPLDMSFFSSEKQ